MKPQIVRKPTEAAKRKQFPLISVRQLDLYASGKNREGNTMSEKHDIGKHDVGRHNVGRHDVWIEKERITRTGPYQCPAQPC